MVSRQTPLQRYNLTTYLSNFIFEVRKRDGKEFPPKTLYHLVCGVQRYLRHSVKSEIDIFKDNGFSEFRVCLDTEMKRLQRKGFVSVSKKAEPLPTSTTRHHHFYEWLYFALRSGKEHRQLRAEPCQITIYERTGERSYLEYREDISKNNSGGIKGRKYKPKIVQHSSNTSNPDRCFVRLFKLYVSLCPSDRSNGLYFKPLQKPTGIYMLVFKTTSWPQQA